MGRIFDRAGPQTYGELCAAAARRKAKVKLSRTVSAWTLEVVASPTEGDPSWRAAAVLFAAVTELDAQARHLLLWLESTRPMCEVRESDRSENNKERRTR
jgi:hypothetical protein